MYTYSFYSFKGGLGRTKTLINTAYLLAAQNYVVVVADMDFHEPGLTLMPEMAPEKGSYPSLGLIDFFGGPDYEANKTPDARQIAYRPALVTDADDAFKGDLFFIPSGKLDTKEDRQRYHDKLIASTLHSLAYIAGDKKEKPFRSPAAVINGIKDQVERIVCSRSGMSNIRMPDFLFIDAGTGFTQMSGVLTEISDHIVMLSGIDRQNVIGLDILLSSFMDKIPINNIPSRMSLVLSPVPEGEDTLREIRLSNIADLMEEKARQDVSRNRKEPMPEPFLISYHPYLAMSDDAIVNRMRNFGHAETYRRLAGHFVGFVQEEAVKRAEAQTGPDDGTMENARKGTLSSHNSLHPMTRTIDWNLLCPLKNWRDLLILGSEADKAIGSIDVFLKLLASSVSLTRGDKKRIIETFDELMEDQIFELIDIFQKERDQFLSATPLYWSRISGLMGEYYAEWVLILDEKELLPDSHYLNALLYQKDVTVQLTAPGIRFMIAMCDTFRKRYRPELAESIISVASAIYPGESGVFQKLGYMHYYMNRLDKAETAYKKAFDLHLASEDVLGMAYDKKGIGDVLLREGRSNEAEAAYREALSLHLKAGDDLGMANDKQGLGDVFLQKAMLDEAQAAYMDALKLHGKAKDDIGMATDMQSLGDIYLRKDMLNEAKQAYRDAMMLHRSVKDDLGMAYDISGMGNAFMRQSMLDEAGVSFKEALDLHRKAGDLLGMANDMKSLGDVLFRKDLLDEAENAYINALEMYRNAGADLGMAYAKIGLGDVYMRKYIPDDAEAAYMDALTLHRDNDDDLGMAYDMKALGELYLKKGMADKAENAYKEALELHRKAKDALGAAADRKLFGEILASKGEYENGLKMIDHAEYEFRNLMDNEGVAECFIARARVYLQMKDRLLAGHALSKASEISKKYGLVFLEKEIRALRDHHK